MLAHRVEQHPKLEPEYYLIAGTINVLRGRLWREHVEALSPQLGHRRWNKAFDQLDLNAVVHDEARNHRKSKDGNYLPPR